MNFIRVTSLFVGFAYLLSIMPVMGMDMSVNDSGMGLGLGLQQDSASTMDVSQDNHGTKRRHATMDTQAALLDSANQRKKRKTDQKTTCTVTLEQKVADNSFSNPAINHADIQGLDETEEQPALSSAAIAESVTAFSTGDTKRSDTTFNPGEVVQVSSAEDYSAYRVPVNMFEPLSIYNLSRHPQKHSIQTMIDTEISSLFLNEKQLNTFIHILAAINKPDFARKLYRDQALVLKQIIVNSKLTLDDVQYLYKISDYQIISALKLACEMIFAEDPQFAISQPTWNQNYQVTRERSLLRRRTKQRHVPLVLEHHYTGKRDNKLSDTYNEQGDLLLHRLFKDNDFSSLIMNNRSMIKDLQESDLFKVEQQIRQTLQAIIYDEPVDAKAIQLTDKQKATLHTQPKGICFDAQGKPLCAHSPDWETCARLEELNPDHTEPLLYKYLQALEQRFTRHGTEDSLYQALEQDILGYLENERTIVSTPKDCVFNAISSGRRIQRAQLITIVPINILFVLLCVYLWGTLGPISGDPSSIQNIFINLFKSIWDIGKIIFVVVHLLVIDGINCHPSRLLKHLARNKLMRNLIRSLIDKNKPPLHFAINAQSSNIVSRLLARGVNVHEVFGGRNAFELAQRPQITQEIKDAIANAGGKERWVTKGKRCMRNTENRIFGIINAHPVLFIGAVCLVFALYISLVISNRDSHLHSDPCALVPLPSSFIRNYLDHRLQPQVTSPRLEYYTEVTEAARLVPSQCPNPSNLLWIFGH